MKALKCAIISTIVILGLLGQSYAVVNTCRKELGTAEPKVYTDCTSEDPDKATCCFVQVKLTNTNTISYCASIPGPYVKFKAIEDFQRDIPFPSVVNCSAGFINSSLLVILLIFISLL